MSFPSPGHLAFLSSAAVTDAQWGAALLSALDVFGAEWHRWRDHNGGLVRVIAARYGTPVADLDALSSRLWPVMHRLVSAGLVERHAGGTTFRLTAAGRVAQGLPAVRPMDPREAGMVTYSGLDL